MTDFKFKLNIFLLFNTFIWGSLHAFNATWVSDFATKTAYRNIKLSAPRFSVPSNCKLVAMDMLIRHGTRLPGDDFILDIPKLQKILLEHGNASIVSDLRSWKIPYSPLKAKDLVLAGAQEMSYLARSVKSWMQSQSCTTSNCRIQVTKKQRTKDSATAFVKELGKGAPTDQDVQDKLLKAYNYCPKLDAGTEEALGPFRDFKRQTIELLATKMKTFLGLPKATNFSVDHFQLMYDMCRFETATNSSLNFSPWCKFFEKETLDTLEFGEDLERFWTKFYGREIISQQSCPLVSSMLQTLKEAAKNSSTPRFRFRFAHSETVIPTVSLLGIIPIDVPPLTASNFPSQRARHFRSSRVAPFAANVALQLLACRKGDQSAGRGDLFVVPLLQERSAAQQFCNAPLCPLREIVSKFEFCSRPDMQLDRLCSLGAGNGATPSGFVVALMFGFIQFIFRQLF